MRKLKFVLPAAAMIFGIFFVAGCKKTTNNTTVVKDSIYYSPWIKLAMTPTDAGDSIFYDDINASHVTQKILSTGAVLSYFGEVGVPSAGDTSVQDILFFNAYQFLSPGVIEIDSYGLGNDLSYSSNFPLLFRYVVIPGSVLASTSLRNMTQQQLQKMNFTDVQRALQPSGQTASGNKVSLP